MAGGGSVSVGVYVLRSVCVLGCLLGAGGGKAEAADDQLFQRRPDRLLIESAQRVSDLRKLQKDADTNFRRAEGGAAGAGSGTDVDRQGSASGAGRAESDESTASAGRR